MKVLSKVILILCFLNSFVYCKSYHLDYFLFGTKERNAYTKEYSGNFYLNSDNITYSFFSTYSNLKRCCFFKSFVGVSSSYNFVGSDYLFEYKEFDNSRYYVLEPSLYENNNINNNSYDLAINNFRFDLDSESCYFDSNNKKQCSYKIKYDVYRFDKINANSSFFPKLFPLDFDTKKALYNLSAKDRKDFFCRAKFGGSVSYANNTRIMPFYSSLRFLKQPTSNTAVIDLKQGWSKYEKKGLFAFVVAGASALSYKAIFSPTSFGNSDLSDFHFKNRIEELNKLDVQKKNQVCEFDCIDEVGNIQTAKMPFYYDLETKSINNDALAICSNTTMRNYDDFVSSNGLNFSMNAFQKQLFEVELQKYIADYILMQNKEYYNELLKEYYDPSLDETYSIYADTHILEQARTTYQAKVYEKEKNDLLDILDKGGFSETSIDYYKKYLDDETINKYQNEYLSNKQAQDEALRKWEIFESNRTSILEHLKAGHYNPDYEALYNDYLTSETIAVYKDKYLEELMNNKDKNTPPPPPLPPLKDGGFVGNPNLTRPGIVGGGTASVGSGSSVGTTFPNVDVNIKDNSTTFPKVDDITKDNAQDNAKEDTKENSKADDITISKDSTTAVEKTQTGSKVDVNVKTDVNVDVNVKAKVDLADILFEPEDIDFELDEIEKKLNILDSVLFFQQDFTNNIKKFLDSFSNIIDELNETKEYFKNLKNPQVVNPTYKNTCPFSKKLEFYGFTIPIEFDICKLVSIIYPATFSFFYVLFFYVFFKLSFKFARAMGAFKLKLK